MTLNFNNAWILYFLWIIPAAITWWLALYKRSVAAKAAFISPELQKRLIPKQKINRQLWQIGIASTAILLLLIAAARPKWGEREETVFQQSRDLVIAVDVSRSMLANDVHPSRLQRAKIDLVDLIKELRGDRAALIAFRSKASLVCPLTTDYAFLRQALDGISPNSAPRGETDIGAAIIKAFDAFDEESASHKAIILISDGEDLTGKAEELAKKAGEKQIPIYTIGIGSRQGSRIPDSNRNARYLQHANKDIITKLNNDTLYAIAKASGGSYIPVETANMTSTTLGTIYRDHLRNINARELAETRETRAIERYQWFLFPAILLILATAALSRGRLATGKMLKKVNLEPTNGRQAVCIQTATKRQILKSKITIPLACLILYGQSIMVAPLQAQTTNTPPTIKSSPTSGRRTPNHAKSAPPSGRRTPNHATQRVAQTPPPINHQPSTKPQAPSHSGARQAQKLFKQEKYSEAAAIYLEAAKGTSRATTRTFKHNAAVALANDGKYKEAADIFKELALQTRNGERDENSALGSMTYRAAEKLNTENAEQAKERSLLLREASEAFKEAWRNNNDNSTARDNIAITLPYLEDAEEQAKILALAKKYEKTQAPQLADKMLKLQREISAELPSAITNTTPNRIHHLEALAARQKELADLWIPLKSKMTQAIAKAQQGGATNAQHFAALTQLMEQTQEEMQNGANKLRDLDAEGFRSAKISEHGTYQLWKTVAPYDMLLNEDLLQQTNTINMTDGSIPADEYINPIQTQTEATQLTQMFKERFEQAVPPEGNLQQRTGDSQVAPPSTINHQPSTVPIGPTIQNAQNQEPSTNAPPQGISAEDRAKIVKLAEEAIGQQTQAVELLKKGLTPEALVSQKIGHKCLTAIQKLLPKQQNQQQNQQKNQQQDQKQDQQQQQQEQQEQQQDQKQEEKQEQQQPKEEKSQEEKDIHKILAKALEREREHQEEKNKRQNQIPLPSFERDW